MAWLTDPRKWSDPWHRQLSWPAMVVFDCCMTSTLRTSLPGLLVNASPHLVADTIGKSVEEVHAAFEVLAGSAFDGRQHFFFDPIYRVVRLPAAPKYNLAPNPNVLAAWFNNWCNAPDSELKWQHLESLRLGVNHDLESMARAWDESFGRVLTLFQQGKKLHSYAELSHGIRTTGRRGSGPGVTTSAKSKGLGNRLEHRGNGSPKGLDNGLGNRLDLRSGSELGSEFELESESGSNGLDNRLEKPTNFNNPKISQNEQKGSSNGTSQQGFRGSRRSSPSAPANPEDHPATATPERRRELELAGWKLSPFGMWIPPGFD
jgi:hypothetical protein